MKRGVGLTDVLLYVFVLILIFFALAITAVGSRSEGIIRIFEIEGGEASQMLRTSIVDRSVRESISAVLVRDERFDGLDVSHVERLAFAATYVYTGADRDAEAGSMWIDRDPRKGMFDAQAFRTEHRYPQDPVSHTSTGRDDIGFIKMHTNWPIFIGREEEPTLGSPPAASRLPELYWLPGYVGPDPRSRGVILSFHVPLEVNPGRMVQHDEG